MAATLPSNRTLVSRILAKASTFSLLLTPDVT
jgi:hypothetical protein